MRANRRRRRLTPAKSRRAERSAPVADDPVVEPDPVVAPEPPRREHLFGSQYRVRMSLDEAMAARGHTGFAAELRRRVVPPNDGQRQRERAVRHLDRGGDVMFPEQ